MKPADMFLWLLALVGVACYALTIWYLDRWSIGVTTLAYLSLRTVLANALIGIACMLGLYAWTGRPLFSVLLVWGLHSLIFIASYMKLSILGSPLELHDFQFISGIDAASVELFSSYAGRPGRMVAYALVALALLGSIWWIERRNGRKSRAGRALRVGSGLVAVVLLGALYFGAWPWMAIFSKHNVRPSPWDAKVAVLRSGLTSSLVYRHVRNEKIGLHVDREALAYALDAVTAKEREARVDSRGGEDWLAPNIVVIQSESFMDPWLLEGMKDLPDVIPTVRALLQQTAGGSMKVPAYGGGTIRTEFEVLTGMPMAAFPDAHFPYMAFGGRKKIPTLAGILSRQGYRTVALHANAGTFWNRNRVYPVMGMQEFIDVDGFKPHGRKDGNWYSDESMTDLILQELRKTDDSPVFVFAVSMENHGPYGGSSALADPERWASMPTPKGLPATAERELRKYLYHLNNADRQLARLIEELGTNGRPTVVLFFGDHLPALPDVYEAIPFVDGMPANQQPVPWVLVANGQVDGDGSGYVLESWQLPELLMTVAGVPGGRYLELTGLVGAGLFGGDRERARRLWAGLVSAANANMRGEFEELDQ